MEDKLKELQAENAQLKLQLTDAEAAKADAEAQVVELNKRLEAAEKTANRKSSNPIIKIGDKDYELTVSKATYKGREITAEVLQKDSQLAERLVKINVGYLVPATEKKGKGKK